MKIRLLLFVLLVGPATLLAFAALTRAQDAFGPRLTATRVNLAHGRVDEIREVGILTKDNKRGNPVKGASEIVDVIAGMPNPRQITLDLNKDGSAPADMKKPSPILVADAATPLSSGMTLIVAEVPAGGTFEGWSPLNTRFSDGNLYAAVSIPDAKIVAGQELTTPQQLKDYSANSIFFEAPDFGTEVVKNNLSGGSTTVTAQINGKKFISNFGFASPLQLTITGNGTKSVSDKTAKVKFFAKLPTSFESPCHLRFAAKSDKETIIKDVVLPASPDDRKQSFRSVSVAFDIQAEVDESVSIRAVASAGPFLEPLPKAPQMVGLKTFQSRGSTLGDTLTIKIKKKKEIDFAAVLEETKKRHMLRLKVFKPVGKTLEGGSRYTIGLDWRNKDEEQGAIVLQAFADDVGAAKACLASRKLLESIKEVSGYTPVTVPGTDEAFEASFQGGTTYQLHFRVGNAFVSIGFNGPMASSNAETARQYAKTIIEQLTDGGP